jgi:hypothetical protein
MRLTDAEAGRVWRARLEEAMDRVAEAERLAKTRRSDRDRLVREAYAEGVPPRVIQEATGLSRQRVSQITGH